MRLDKFLKVSRLIKRRTLAKEVADQGRITVNGNQAKASSDVKAGDELTVRFGQKLVTVKVNELKETTKKKKPRACIQSSRKKNSANRLVLNKAPASYNAVIMLKVSRIWRLNR